MLRPVISRTFFTQLLVIGLGLGLSLINLMFFVTFWNGLSTIMFILVLITQTFPFCYVCELIHDDCYNLSLAIFYSKSIDASRRYKSTLLYFLQNTQKPIEFTAGRLFLICMKTNISVSRQCTGFSNYFTNIYFYFSLQVCQVCIFGGNYHQANEYY